MKTVISVLALALLTIGMATAYTPTWTIDKAVDVTGDYKWSSGQWNYGEWHTAGYGFQAYGAGYNVNYQESESLGNAWKYDFDNMLSADVKGAVHAFADVTTVNDPSTTPATGGFTKYAFGTKNDGEFSHTTVVVSGQGFANIDHSASFDSDFSSQNFFCVNDCE